jgi:hypothetical protein
VTVSSPEERIDQTQRAIVSALAVIIILLSAMNIYLATWVISYPSFWRDTMGGKPMSMGATLITGHHAIYRLIAWGLLAGALTPFIPVRFLIQYRIALITISLAGLQLLASFHFMAQDWWNAAVNARLF